MLDRLPRYRASLAVGRKPTSEEGRANAVETVVGCAYACYTNFKFLQADESFRWDKAVQADAQGAWSFVWQALTMVGICATVEQIEVPAAAGPGSASPAAQEEEVQDLDPEQEEEPDWSAEDPDGGQCV